MKTNKKKTAAVAAFLSLIQMGHAGASCTSFTAIDELPPEVRQHVSAKLAELAQTVEIDWDSVVAGVTNEGAICLKAKNGSTTIAGSSCYTSRVENPTK